MRNLTASVDLTRQSVRAQLVLPPEAAGYHTGRMQREGRQHVEAAEELADRELLLVHHRQPYDAPWRTHASPRASAHLATAAAAPMPIRGPQRVCGAATARTVLVGDEARRLGNHELARFEEQRHLRTRGENGQRVRTRCQVAASDRACPVHVRVRRAEASTWRSKVADARRWLSTTRRETGRE
jgi:hypothetical protein